MLVILNFVGDVIERNDDVINVISKYRYFKKAVVAIFAEIIKIITRFVKKIFKKIKKIKKNKKQKLCIKMQSISIFLDIIKFADFR